MTAMSAARAAIVAQVAPLKDAAGVAVEPYARSAVIGQPTVMVRLDRITKKAPWRVYQAALLVLVPQTIPGDADDELDNLLEDVLAGLEVALAGTSAVWTEAQRATFKLEDGPGFPCYEVSLTMPIVPTTTQE